MDAGPATPPRLFLRLVCVRAGLLGAEGSGPYGRSSGLLAGRPARMCGYSGRLRCLWIRLHGEPGIRICEKTCNNLQRYSYLYRKRGRPC